MAFKILLVEDDNSQIKLFEDTVKRLNEQRGKEIYFLDTAQTIDEAKEKIVDENYSGSVVDIKLKNEENGNDVIVFFRNQFRNPIVAYTGTPDVDYGVPCLKKGEKDPEEVICELENQEATGLFKVLGGKGELEKRLTSTFWDSLYPYMDVWKNYSDEGIKTEIILLRYALANILEQLEDNDQKYCTEEMYIKGSTPPLKTGSIYEHIELQKDYILLSPPCDIALHEDLKMKTDTLLLCEVEEIDWSTIKNENIKSVVGNNSGENYHWLPANKLYHGGRINFRKLINCVPDEIEKKYKYKIKVQDVFVKNILNRFSAYYARQGQPDLDSTIENKTIDEIKAKKAAKAAEEAKAAKEAKKAAAKNASNKV